MAVIALVGGVGVGKTFFGKQVIEKYPNIQFVEEDTTKNLYLNEFYEDMRKWGFHSRISMLTMILSETAPYYEKKGIVMIDRCVNELIVFARKEYEEGNMSEKEFELYLQLYTTIINLLPKPDLYIFFDCSSETALERIQKRGRECENDVSIEFCEDVLKRYRLWRKSLECKRIIDINTEEELNIDEIVNKVLKII